MAILCGGQPCLFYRGKDSDGFVRQFKVVCLKNMWVILVDTRADCFKVNEIIAVGL